MRGNKMIRKNYSEDEDLDIDESAKKASREKKGFYLIILALLVIVTGVVFVVWSTDSTKLDEASGCPIVNGKVTPNSHTVVLVDQTDVLTMNQIDAIRVRMKNYVDMVLQPGDLFSIYLVDADRKKSRQAVFSMCKIRDGSDASSLTENEKMMRQKFQDFFSRPLNKVFTQLTLKETDSKTSPLFEVIQSIGINDFEKWHVNGQRHLLIYSDMLHNTKEFTMYRSQLDSKSFLKSDYYQTIRPHLDGVEVQLNYLANRPKFQKNSNLEFWQRYFANAQAMVVRVDTLGK